MRLICWLLGHKWRVINRAFSMCERCFAEKHNPPAFKV